MAKKPKVGDLVHYSWAHNLSVTGLVVGIWDPPNYHSGIDYTLEILEEGGRKFIYDVWLNGDPPEILASP